MVFLVTVAMLRGTHSPAVAMSRATPVQQDQSLSPVLRSQTLSKNFRDTATLTNRGH